MGFYINSHNIGNLFNLPYVGQLKEKKMEYIILAVIVIGGGYLAYKKVKEARGE